MVDLIALAERCEAASGPDRDLDAAILANVFPDEWQRLRIEAGMPCGAPEDMMTDGARERVKYRAQYHYSTSLDAAMSLVPEGTGTGGERLKVEEWNGNGVHACHVRASAWVSGAPRVYAATPALALTAAALRARASMEAQHG